LVGLTRGSTAAHIARAALDSIAYQTYDVLLAMQSDSSINIRELRVDGGATVNNQLMQFQSDILQSNVVRPSYTETTALGAAYLAGLAVNFWSDMDELKKHWQIGRTFSPSIPMESTSSLIKGWHRAINASHAWAGDGELN
jgi:glycerol kinase